MKQIILSILLAIPFISQAQLNMNGRTSEQIQVIMNSQDYAIQKESSDIGSKTVYYTNKANTRAVSYQINNITKKCDKSTIAKALNELYDTIESFKEINYTKVCDLEYIDKYERSKYKIDIYEDTIMIIITDF